MRISIPAVDRIVRTSERLGLDVQLPRVINGWLAEAATSGLENEELAALIKVLRRRKSARAAHSGISAT